ncbi:unnamed protein product [Prorocentrum cordatum]|uniref:Uncharacterized protein n=1 Tax=Prorocentrum cordatum TaxID=2364126 RepID=A0ABN9ST14_9DINO|nr:unnamed protein product [Polarella glacialis]
MYFHTDAHSKTPPELDWRTIGPHRGDADPPPTISYVQAGDAGTTHNDVGTAGGLQAQPAGANGGLLEYFWFWFSTSLRLDSAGLGVLYTVLHIRGQETCYVFREFNMAEQRSRGICAPSTRPPSAPTRARKCCPTIA